jgi:hypothetical protein
MARILWAHCLGEIAAGKKIFLSCVCVSTRNKKEVQYWSNIPLNDDLSKKGKQDDIRINLSQPWERQYWAKKLDITQKRLKELVKDAGPLVSSVMERLTSSPA